eukprot:scaffold2366_cov115-Cylindrotheca_fusiformis.AAC.15
MQAFFSPPAAAAAAAESLSLALLWDLVLANKIPMEKHIHRARQPTSDCWGENGLSFLGRSSEGIEVRDGNFQYTLYIPLFHRLSFSFIIIIIPSLTPGQVVHCSNEEEYFEILQLAGDDQLVIVDCFAEWCPPCKAIAPVFEALAKEHPDKIFLKVDVDKVPSIKRILGVWAMPTFAFLKQGSKVGSLTGAQESKLRYGIEHDGNVGMCASCTMM